MASIENPPDRVVQRMFDRIAGRYDLVNRVISFRLDNGWRKKAIAAVLRNGNERILDLGTGTGDLTFAAAKSVQGDGRIIGLDFSLPMIRLARAKQKADQNGDRTHFVQASALRPPFADEVFDGIMTAFVLRNVSDLRLFFIQSFRLLKPGGRLVSLDMFPPSKGAFSLLYSFYFYRLMPSIGGLLAQDRQAYQYLSDSVRQFASPEKIAELIEQCGFEKVTLQRFLFGAVCLHMADKPRHKNK
ncbi:MAG: ubiquinone/menaquinone biosynthesis methyltransferase [Candidatus Binatia bacterium]